MHSVYDKNTSYVIITPKAPQEIIDKIKSSSKLSGISDNFSVIPLDSVKTDFYSFKNRRALLDAGDVFMADRKIIHTMSSALGKMFIDSKKFFLALKKLF